MEFNINKVLELRFEGDEINNFLSVLDTIKTKAQRSGFKKSFTKENQEFVDFLHYNLIGDQDEKNNDKGK